VWHDRAAFHFLTNEKDIEHYISSVHSALNEGGIFIIGTFSENGPLKCSGLPIQQYSREKMISLLKLCFENIKCIESDHKTPFGTQQNFLFCSFKKINS